MPYFSDTSSAPKIRDEYGRRTVRTTYGKYDGGSLTGAVNMTRLITTQQYRLVGLTEAAALAGVMARSDTYSFEDRTARRMSADGAWQLQVSRDSWSTLSVDTEAITV